jgi:dihydrofolate reductase
VGNLVYSSIASLDGYVADEEGNFDWAAPDEEVHAFVNDLERSIGAYLYGRRLYEVMRFWEDADLTDQSAYIRGYAEIWRAADKFVFSSTLERVSTARTRLERTFDADAVRRLKAEASRDVSVGGPGLGGQAIRAGLVDEWHLFVVPVLVGGGTRALPEGVTVELELLDQRRFANGTVHLHYRSRGDRRAPARGGRGRMGR